jgi:threonine/homoserine/homoserine lactone efflux protein
MQQSILEGISMGLVLSAMIGPVFFSLVQGSLQHGFRYSAALALGVLVSDSLYVVVTYFGLQLFSETDFFEMILGYLGGLILIGFGIRSLFKKSVDRISTGGIDLPKARKRSAFAKGFGINGINPFVMLFWISIVGIVQLKEHFQSKDIALYYIGILLTVFAIDLLKALVAKQMARWVTPRVMWVLNKLVGLIIIGFGLRMIWTTWT